MSRSTIFWLSTSVLIGILTIQFFPFHLLPWDFLLPGGLLELFVVVMLFSFIIVFAVNYSGNILQQRMAEALKQCDYATTLRYVRILRYFPYDDIALAYFVRLHGAVLLFAGRLAEAEPLLIESRDVQFLKNNSRGKRKEQLAETQKQTHYAAYSNLGSLYMAQQRYQEAIWAQEAAMELLPDNSIPYAGLAEIYLKQGIEAERALLLLDRALEREQANPEEGVLPVIYACRAWALTMLGQHEAADEMLTQAFREADPDHKQRLAGLHLVVGRVWRLRGEHKQARDYFNKVREIDPSGWNNSLALEELEKLE